MIKYSKNWNMELAFLFFMSKQSQKTLASMALYGIFLFQIQIVYNIIHNIFLLLLAFKELLCVDIVI